MICKNIVIKGDCDIGRTSDIMFGKEKFINLKCRLLM